jgi:hypothetical protein
MASRVANAPVEARYDLTECRSFVSFSIRVVSVVWS